MKMKMKVMEMMTRTKMTLRTKMLAKQRTLKFRQRQQGTRPQRARVSASHGQQQPQ